MDAADWAQPGAYEVAEGIYRLPLPLPGDGLRAVNVYALLHGSTVTLVDSGWVMAETRDALQVALGRLGVGLGDIDRFLITHAHRDHFTQAVALRREFGTSIAIGQGERRALELAADPVWQPSHQHRDFLELHGARALVKTLDDRGLLDSTHDSSEWALPDHWVQDREHLSVGERTLEARATPGHTVGHFVFVEESGGLLFAGDHVLPRITPAVGFEPETSMNPLGAYIASLSTVRSLPDMILLPAHGPVGGSVHQRVDELLDHHGVRLDQTLSAVNGGFETAFAVAGALTWTSRGRELEDLDPYNRFLAVLETVHHLSLLVARGVVTRTVVDGIARYA